MKTKSTFRFFLLLSSFITLACKNNNPKPDTKHVRLKEETITYTVDSLTLNSYLVYNEQTNGKRPAILVVHEWWGLNDYAKHRARMLAELGHTAMAVDMYGNGRMGNDPATAQALAMPYYNQPEMAKKIFDAAVEQVKKSPTVDTSKIAGIGYCFGGGILLNLARMGEPLKGIVSFHGSLVGTPANKDLTQAEILICHGGADPFVPKEEVETFKKQMDSIGKAFTFRSYPGALHAFTNPDATGLGKKFNLPIAYDAAADSASWQEMKDFFSRIFK